MIFLSVSIPSLGSVLILYETFLVGNRFNYFFPSALSIYMYLYIDDELIELV